MRRHPRDRRGRAVLVLIVVIAGILGSAGPALSHETLRRSSPAKGDTLSVAPREIRLTFSDPVELTMMRVGLTGPNGAVALGELTLHPDSSVVVRVPVEGGLIAGSYTVSWQVVGPDGHPVRGEVPFTIAPAASGLSLPPAPESDPPPSAHHPMEAFPEGGGFDAESRLYVAVRWLTFVGLLGVIGPVAFPLVLGLVRRRYALQAGPWIVPAAARAARLGFWMAVLLGLSAGLRLLAQSYAVHGSAGALDFSLVATMLSDTFWGWGWLLQAAGSVLALLGFALARRSHATGGGIAAIGVLTLAFTPGMSGHAAAASHLGIWPVLADGLHVLGAGGWLGGLLTVIVVGIPTAMALGGEQRGQIVAALVNAFSPTALFFAGLTVATGVFAAWVHLGSVVALWQSDYGRTLLLKVGLLVGIFATGAHNWLRVRPALGDDIAAGRLRRSAIVELAVGVIVLAVTAVLVATSPPDR